jgi:hypothetical protein
MSEPFEITDQEHRAFTTMDLALRLPAGKLRLDVASLAADYLNVPAHFDPLDRYACAKGYLEMTYREMRRTT